MNKRYRKKFPNFLVSFRNSPRISKRGQITIFIIVGIIIVILAAVILFYAQKNTIPEKNYGDLNEEKFSIKSQVESCLDQSIEKAIVHVGMQGGYYYVPVKSQSFVQTKVPYYFYKNQILTPKINEMEKQLSIAIEKIARDCIDEIQEYEEKKGLIVNIEIEEVQSHISNEAVTINAKVPTNFYFKDDSDGESTIVEISDFEIKKNLHYGKIISWAKKIIDIQVENPAWFPLSKISDLAYEEGFKYEMIGPQTINAEAEENEEEEFFPPEDPEDKNKVILSILDKEMFGKPYYFSFAIFYDSETVEKAHAQFEDTNNLEENNLEE
jgi:hypothetical protein